jgi:hypothetical protein
MSPKIISIKETEKDGKKIIERIVKDEVAGNIRQVLTIAPGEVVLRRWSAWGYGEKRLKKVTLTRPYKGISVILSYDYGFEGEGRSHWCGVDIVSRNNEDVDKLLSKIKDFDTFTDTLECLYRVCKAMSYVNVVECDITACL